MTLLFSNMTGLFTKLKNNLFREEEQDQLSGQQSINSLRISKTGTASPDQQKKVLSFCFHSSGFGEYDCDRGGE